mmetsp:Transcript_5907/g.14563  ORF Transcript_5907/g.14563 Transcript_5907/m.14563 type:complete len:320 (+) Transcript_5907:251-1210(+)
MRPSRTSAVATASRAAMPGWLMKAWRSPACTRSHIQARDCSRRLWAQAPLAMRCSRWVWIAAQSGAMPSAFSALTCSTRCSALACSPAGAVRPEPSRRKAEVIWAWARVAAAGSRSALLMTMRSASSMTPFLMACRSSPALGSCSSTYRSVMPATAVSLWPTPTVSTMTTSNPAASHSSIASRVFSATPPSVPLLGLGRMKARRSMERRSMRVLSPRMAPPETLLDGSTASTATRWPWSIRNRPKASMKVLLPTPGTPEMPSRSAPPVAGISSVSRASAWARWSARVDSTCVIALASARRSPARTPAARFKQAPSRPAA